MANKKFSQEKKDRKKAIRSVIQGIILIVLLIIIIRALFTFKKYTHFTEDKRVQREEGFIAVSYFGVDRIGSETLISKKLLDKHIKALKDSGYTSITQKDIENYYLNGENLPEKSLFLIFEDGRRDTAIFSQKILEKYNYIASILSYGENLDIKSHKFLNGKDMKTLLENDFWEIGSNGYRLSYINVFDRHANYFGELDTNEYQELSTYLDRNYNHYLMDYIRDENHMPKESFEEMERRISKDYIMMKDVYLEHIDFFPKLYVLMHSNTGKFGTNERVSKVNEEYIYKLFTMNFNREGNSKNTYESSIYDLTRIQPQAYWSTNHLLMRIWDDTGMDMAFVSGDEKKKSYWDTVLGQSEFIEDKIILTSLPRDIGLMFLEESEDYKDFQLSLYLKGNKKGSQGVYLRSNKNLDKYILIEIKDNILYIYEEKEGNLEELFTLNLDIHDEIIYQTMEENKIESEIQYIKTKLKYGEKAYNEEEIEELLLEKENKKDSMGAYGNEYIPKIDIKEKGDRFLEIQLVNNSLSLSIDNKRVFENLKVSLEDSGYIGLESSYGEQGYSQRNLYDVVYDGVFQEIVVKEANEKDVILYENTLTKEEKLKIDLIRAWEGIIGFFIKYL
ncbi:MAG: glycoside hydrolase [Tissierellia bacterium]|nr:glycoside hydrolase [Tissierellia bacterium]